jgi:PAS domain S-box-containing protein
MSIVTSHAAHIALLEQLVEFAPDALLVVNAQGRIVLVNSTTQTLFGFPPTELLDKPIETLVPDRLRSLHVRHRAEYEDTPRTREMGAALSGLLATRADGSEFPVEIRLSPLHVGGETLVAAAVRDVTDRRQVAAQLRAARREADRANAAKSRFLATASHDLRQPLQALQLLNAAAQKNTTDTTLQELLARQQEALESMGRLLNALLDISKLEAGRIQPQWEAIDLTLLCRQLHQQYAPLAGARGLDLKLQPAEHCIRTDRTLFRQLLENILGNAIKYTERGMVTLSCAGHGDGLRITVADTGVGIAPEHLAAIFEEFYQIGQQETARGLGLGLAIVRRIARLLQLEVAVNSTAGSGTEFHIDIPAQLLASAPAAMAAGAATADTGIRAAIMLIEDDTAVRQALSFYLRTVGHSVTATASIAEAEQALEAAAQAPDLIISDYHLGKSTSSNATGIDAILHLRQRAGTQIPALLLSGDTSSALRLTAEVPACRMLSKPVDGQALAAAIDVSLDATAPAAAGDWAVSGDEPVSAGKSCG